MPARPLTTHPIITRPLSRLSLSRFCLLPIVLQTHTPHAALGLLHSLVLVPSPRNYYVRIRTSMTEIRKILPTDPGTDGSGQEAGAGAGTAPEQLVDSFRRLETSRMTCPSMQREVQYQGVLTACQEESHAHPVAGCRYSVRRASDG